MICDEPTAHLDQANALQLGTLLRQLTEDGAACLLATHDQTLADLAHVRLTLSSGRLQPQVSRSPHAVRAVDEGR
jgi:putative ABC transport system ATP-binding protein